MRCVPYAVDHSRYPRRKPSSGPGPFPVCPRTPARARPRVRPERGFLTGTIRSADGNAERDLRGADEVRAVAADADVTPAQVAPARLLTRGCDVAPWPPAR